MRVGIALLSCFAVPFHGLCCVFCYSFAIVIAKCQIILRDGVTLFCRFSFPFHGLLIVLRYALTIIIAIGEFMLGNRVALLSSLPEALDCIDIVLIVIILYTLVGLGKTGLANADQDCQ